MNWEAIGIGFTALTFVVGAVVYIVRLEGTTRVLKAELASVKEFCQGLDGKVDQILAALLTPQEPALPGRRVRRAGKAPDRFDRPSRSRASEK